MTEKWKDKWFRQLKPNYKLLWIYLLDNCDISGIIEWDIDLWKRDLGFRFIEDGIRESFSKRIISIPKTEYIWIPKFIEIQQRCKIEALNPENNAHKGILRTIEKYNLLSLLSLIEGANEGLISPISNSKGISTGKSKDKEDVCTKEKPLSAIEANEYFITISGNIQDSSAWFDHFQSNGWKIGGKTPMKDWRASARTWMRNKNNFSTKTLKPDSPMVRKKNYCLDCRKETSESGIVCPQCTEKRRMEDEKLSREQSPEEIQKQITESLKGI